ncbi:PucR family transcriptional regulator [Indiicoccus explosivorum]|uniref:PucR family transcriptional regulator n=1 Tax=Indiicoccus explosivorum TaxID=1917864 RepID=UPI00138FE98C|nr:PucR family transcriptional regulator [Indiicoccus explosivorum]
MSITVHEAMALPVMAKTKLAAGAKGLHRPIRWVTIVEVIEDISRLQQGEFLVTTGYGLDTHEERFIALMDLQKLSGVAIYTGFYLKKIPESFLAAADRNSIPLIEIPADINFSSLTEGILQEILNRQMELIASSLRIHKELTGLVLKGQGEETITETLAGLIGASVFRLNESGDAIQSADINGLDDGFSQLQPLFEMCRRKAAPSTHHQDRLMAAAFPIMADNVFYGAILAIKPEADWKAIDRSVLEHAATVYAIEQLKTNAIEQTQVTLRGEFLEEILQKNFKNRALALVHGRKLGFDLSLPHTVIHLKPADAGQVAGLNTFTSRQLTERNIHFISKERLDGITVLIQSDADSCRVLAEELITGWDGELIIGIGRTTDDVGQLSSSAAEAKQAADLHLLPLQPGPVVHYDDLGTYRLLLEVREAGGSLRTFYEEALDDLLPTSASGIDFIETLNAFFKHHGSVQAAAEELFIHRHTLKYRLDQAEKRSGCRLDSADDRLRLQLAIAAWRLDHHLERQ